MADSHLVPVMFVPYEPNQPARAPESPVTTRDADINDSLTFECGEGFLLRAGWDRPAGHHQGKTQ